MVPNIFIIGKFNVGKSMFFNNISESSKNLSLRFKSLTSNLKKTLIINKNFNYLICDTSGFNFFVNFNINFKTMIYYSDIVFFLIDKNIGIFYEDKYVLNLLKLAKKYIYLVINKIDIKFVNINIFYFYKILNNKPYIINCSNNNNGVSIINSVLDSYCKYKNCYHFKNKRNNLKVFLICYNKFQLKNMINNLFMRKVAYINCKDMETIDFRLSKLFIKFYFSFILHFNIKKFLKKIIFINFLKILILSKIIFIFIDPFCNNMNYQFIIKLTKLNLKFIVFIINFLYDLGLKYKIYFLSYFKKKYNLFYFYVFFISIFKKYNFFYFFNYCLKYLKIIKVNLNLKKFLLNLNNFLNFQKKKMLFKITHIKQKGFNPILIIIHGKNLQKLNNYSLSLIKINLIFFYKLKSFSLKFFKKN